MRVLYAALVALALALLASEGRSAQWAENLTLKDGKLTFKTSATASVTPASGYTSLYSLPNNRLYFMASDGIPHDVLTGGTALLNDLLDVDTSTATTGQALVFDGASWIGGNVAQTLASLLDVDTTTATIGEFLGFDGTKWINTVVPQINALDDIGDVNVAGAISGQVLGFDGTNWVPSTGGKTMVGASPIVITQDSSTATFSFAGQTLDDLSDVDVASAVDGQILTKSSTGWTATNPSVSAGAGLMLYPYTTLSTIVGTYYQYDYTPQNVGESTVSVSVTSATSPLLMRTYLYERTVDTTSLNGGQWTVDFWNYVDSAAGVTNLRIVIFKRTSGGVETDLLTLDLPENNSTSNIEQVVKANLATQAINATDRIGFKVYALTTSATARTVTYTIGNGTHYSSVSTPVNTRHNDLRGLQGGTTNEYYHNTANQNTVMGTLSASGTVTTSTNSLQLGTSVYNYYGDANTNGSFRTYSNGSALITEQRVSGSWVEVYRLE